MVRVFFTLIDGQEFDPRLGYKTTLKLVINIYSLMSSQNAKD